ncbi:MAG: 6,7-dimethyl-8-ribityllumazine synthase [Flavitalea sp.]
MADVNNSKLLNIHAGILPKDACVVIVRTEWNADILDELERGCVETLRENGTSRILVINVPGAVEITFAINSYWQTNRNTDAHPNAFIALGCVIQGDTPHFDYVCKSVTDGITHLNITLPVPVIFGVLTVNTKQQAEERIGGIHGHKGKEAAITALKMISIARSMSSLKPGNKS